MSGLIRFCGIKSSVQMHRVSTLGDLRSRYNRINCKCIKYKVQSTVFNAGKIQSKSLLAMGGVGGGQNVHFVCFSGLNVTALCGVSFNIASHSELLIL